MQIKKKKESINVNEIFKNLIFIEKYLNEILDKDENNEETKINVKKFQDILINFVKNKTLIQQLLNNTNKGNMNELLKLCKFITTNLNEVRKFFEELINTISDSYEDEAAIEPFKMGLHYSHCVLNKFSRVNIKIEEFKVIEAKENEIRNYINKSEKNESKTNRIFNYIYLLQEREFINTNQSIYKIGKTKCENLSRFCQYPKGSLLILQTLCYEDCDNVEKKIISLFISKYIQRTDIGREYFEGNVEEMENDIFLLSKNKENTTKYKKPVIVENSNIEIINDFINEIIITKEGVKLNCDLLFTKFKIWYYDPSKKLPKRKELYDIMDKKYERCDRVCWKDITIIDPENIDCFENIQN
jgi:hypothetical protein